MTLDIVIMAAGKGTRMRSAKPKVLHRLADRSLLQHVLDRAAALAPERTLVITGHGAAQVEAAVGDAALCVRQEPQLGTGHAIQQVVPHLGDTGTTLILNGDVPLISPATARALAQACGGERLALLTVVLDDATGYGRIVRQGEQVQAIVEHKDASDAQRQIREVYTGMMAAPTAALKRWVMALTNANAQQEYYLTDIVAMAVAEGVPVVAATAPNETEVLGVNSPAQLADLERRFQRAEATRLMEAGLRLADPARFDLRGTLSHGMDCEVDVGCIFEGAVVLGDNVRIGAHCVVRNAQIGDGAVIHPFTHIDGDQDGAVVGAGSLIGPFARLRPGARLGREVHIGNFVEVKNSTLADGAKANHLAYLGDATVGERVNYGAGSITANYDGANKHRTVIEADVHVGSNCVLIAPVTLGAGGTIGGGSTVSKDTPPGQLTVARAKQVSLGGWSRPVKAPKK
ncbi:bifunctional UDP-N-acetylglucosamine diphosphorylase/glucosamine-1-phosphate N-acetyltransferase GlmU [Ideonella sp. 4Y16]|uniref:Bifunctional protein GlmU n=1 Tax=Ideonella alba TaxID=2824118 RepID=A0A940Y885_9BURK|nr:bifunctional UDP-N-acetylglucosamine diphosphorylase/glucosamine-1-phosphate N-acetyltransferase GlmU [Ideonella alba]MBQ0930010.1 bifunctional UDP-N-acetylglucosamine diphosphorylase/glucosamine-1-phosphate N-acetyltransferase GlmU [Ideonella alba]MBQ0946070.1 bifunctional UDP-N-acetylglucosamine diphosphorylase/glucosamine-1-phosphate N-acetyltransferase GlmU [Ideonella alba]